MGLDNGFEFRSRKNPNVKIEVASFRNYYELNKYMMQSGKKTEFEYEVEVSKELLEELLNKIKPIRDKLIKLPGDTVAYYDDHKYPDEYYEEFHMNEFNPATNESMYAGCKLLQLYERINTMLEAFENARYQSESELFSGDDFYISFYSSF